MMLKTITRGEQIEIIILIITITIITIQTSPTTLTIKDSHVVGESKTNYNFIKKLIKLSIVLISLCVFFIIKVISMRSLFISFVYFT